ncbi:MAG: sulfotransferase family protein [Bacteroidia bacterium]|jgi:hypothetical protein|nr:sulfotransferase family protein [Bacteroidia bacterium]
MPHPDHLIFLHIQKTAGTTLYEIISRQYPQTKTKLFYNPPMALKFGELTPAQRNTYALLTGHQPYGMHQFFTRGTTEYITLLREPVDRTVSHFYHLGSDKTHPFNEEYHREKYSIIRLLESGKILNLNNCMVRLLSGEYDRAYDACDEAMLEKAVQHLDTMALVGLHNQFDIFLLRAAERYHWNAPYYSKRRVSTTRIGTHELDARSRECIEHYNKLDIALYRMMKPRIEAIQKELGDEFYARLSRFQRRNAVVSKFLNVYHSLRRTA